jgi:hypothetical protein
MSGEWSTIRNLKKQGNRPPFYSTMFGYREQYEGGAPSNDPSKTFWKRGPSNREMYAARKTQTYLHPTHAPWRREYYDQATRTCGFDSMTHLSDHKHTNPLGDIGTLLPHPTIASTLDPHSRFNSSRVFC